MNPRWLERVLDDGEEVVLHERPHWRQVALPIALLPVVVGLASYAYFAMPGSGLPRSIGRAVVLAVALVVLGRWSLLPWLRWRTTHYVLTTNRLIVRSGVFVRTDREVPLARVNDVTSQAKIRQRILGCGTIVVESGGERGQFVLADASTPAEWQRQMNRLRGRWGDR